MNIGSSVGSNDGETVESSPGNSITDVGVGLGSCKSNDIGTKVTSTVGVSVGNTVWLLVGARDG